MYSRSFLRTAVLPLCWGLLVNFTGVEPIVAGQELGTQKLYIAVEESQDAINNLQAGAVREMVVRVDDENHKPVAGALVTFSLPRGGPGGNFFVSPNGSKVFQAFTNSEGKAAARFLPNTKGQFQIDVTASSGGRIGNVVITQKNILPFHFLGMSGKTLAIVGSLAAAGAAGAGIAATRGGGATVTPGAPTVGAPR